MFGGYDFSKYDLKRGNWQANWPAYVPTNTKTKFNWKIGGNSFPEKSSTMSSIAHDYYHWYISRKISTADQKIVNIRKIFRNPLFTTNPQECIAQWKIENPSCAFEYAGLIKSLPARNKIAKIFDTHCQANPEQLKENLDLTIETLKKRVVLLEEVKANLASLFPLIFENEDPKFDDNIETPKIINQYKVELESQEKTPARVYTLKIIEKILKLETVKNDISGS